MSSDPNSLAKYDPPKFDNVREKGQQNVVSKEATNDAELAKVLAKFDNDIIQIVLIEKDSGRLREDSRVRSNIRERINLIIQNAAMLLGVDSRANLLNSIGLKLLDTGEHTLAKENFENSLLLADMISDPAR